RGCAGVAAVGRIDRVRAARHVVDADVCAAERRRLGGGAVGVVSVVRVRVLRGAGKYRGRPGLVGRTVEVADAEREVTQDERRIARVRPAQRSVAGSYAEGMEERIGPL